MPVATERLARTRAAERHLRCIATIAMAPSPTSRTQAGLDVEMYGWALPSGDFNNGWLSRPLRLLCRRVGFFQNNGRRRFTDLHVRRVSRREHQYLAAPIVLKKPTLSYTGDEEVGKAIVVEVADGNAQAVHLDIQPADA